MIVGRHKKTRHLYSRIEYPTLPENTGKVRVRSADSGRWYSIPSEMFEAQDETWRYAVRDNLPLNPTLDDPLAGEPTEDMAEVDHDRGLVEDEIDRMLDQLGWHVSGPPEKPSISDLPAPVLPLVHQVARDKSYAVGSVIALLSEIEPHWPDTSVANTLNVCVLLLRDELTRVERLSSDS